MSSWKSRIVLVGQRLVDAVMSREFLGGLSVGASTGVIAATSLAATTNAVTILLAMLAVDVAVISVVIACNALVVVLSPEYLNLVSSAQVGGPEAFLRPYVTIAYVSVSGGISSLIVALVWPAIPVASDGSWRLLHGLLMGVAGLFTGWSLFGAASLVELGKWHFKSNRRLQEILRRSSGDSGPS